MTDAPEKPPTPGITDEDRRWAKSSAEMLFGRDGQEDGHDLAGVALRAMERAQIAEAALAAHATDPHAAERAVLERVRSKLRDTIKALSPRNESYQQHISGMARALKIIEAEIGALAEGGE